MVAVLECNHEYQAHPTDSTPALRNGTDFVRIKKTILYLLSPPKISSFLAFSTASFDRGVGFASCRFNCNFPPGDRRVFSPALPLEQPAETSA
jgi:hypothetical protein